MYLGADLLSQKHYLLANVREDTDEIVNDFFLGSRYQVKATGRFTALDTKEGIEVVTTAVTFYPAKILTLTQVIEVPGLKGFT